ncbi:hypothetical protein A2415_00635 [candidate division WWE3 bacterium RIFOXYC1_FULL_39_7]|uniref:Glycosyltransferase RgtA/B/C/D-like domain-containing protein n=2 Tax=Katanobacteria TaxID=422282 RepID=A0A1F4X6R1_UNCKA|nr:MAG: hypothetical protein A2415_00635 [candidate division WWE3 bacterium RIFOXYC1_FULL_39_7]OGC77348.1 MAG: hypothetical protein A2619_04920 [candidate division WWE3 bacterium RIFOXYD1_FULL_39_9]
MQKYKALLLIVFTFLYFLTRVPRLNNDIINPDGVNWHYRSEQFINGLKYAQFDKTYQHYHPGVTLMWATGVPIELTKHLIGQKVYSTTNFETFDFVAKASLVIIQFVLTLLILWNLNKLFGFNIAVSSMFLFTFEPFFIGNSRLYHLDVLFTLLSFSSLSLIYLSLKESNNKYLILGSILGALAFLTKSIGIGILVYISLIIILGLIKKFLSIKQFVLFLAVYVVTVFLLFPALWVKPIYYLSEIFSESERIGIRKGHEQIVFGETVIDAGASFYPLVLLIKFSPVLLFGLILGVFFGMPGIKSKLKSYFIIFDDPLVFFGIFYLGYMVVMTISSKKIDRYMVVLFPYLAVLAVIGYGLLLKKIKNVRNFSTLIGLICGVFIVYPIVSQFPFYFVYTSPLFGSPERANSVIAQKPFGVGIHDLKNALLEKYGEDVDMGFIDTKPMKAIYSNSKVFDIRVNGTSDYDVIVLGVNEEMPEAVSYSKQKFEKDFSFYINGLEYWKVYVKQK